MRIGAAYVSRIWVDAVAKTRSGGFTSIDYGDYSWSGEVGYETEVAGIGEGNYRASWFHSDRTGRDRTEKAA